MLKSSVRPVIRLRGVRPNNLKNFDLDLPLNQLIVVTGLSGSGKSSLAFDTLFAEGQRRYIETFSPYARQFFDRMDKPQVDSIEGIPPAIAIEQRNAVKTTRSTVGTMTEICDYMKLVWPQIAELHCRQCGRPVRKEPPQEVWKQVTREVTASATPPPATPAETARPDSLITFDLALTEKLTLAESLALVAKQGYQRLLVDNQIVRLEDALPRLAALRAKPSSLTVVQDRVAVRAANRSRFVEACEQAYHFGKGKLTLWEVADTVANPHHFSNRFHCAQCDIEYRPPSPALFSFNHPVGACPTCRGFGRVISIDYRLALPDRTRTLAQGVVKPWQTGLGAECQTDLLRMCRQFDIPTDVPFDQLPRKWQDFVVEGEPGYGSDTAHEWPRAWYGIKGYFRWLESRAYKMHVRVLLSRYRAYSPCPDCHGQRFQPESLLYRVEAPAVPHIDEYRNAELATASGTESREMTLAGFYQLPIRDACRFVDRLVRQRSMSAKDPLSLVLHEVRSRLGYLNDVGLGYLTLDRPTRSLSGGETERVSLTTCLGTRLVNTLFVLDEPSVGLHPRDTERLVRVLEQLRDAGNTVLVVEHEASVMRAANQIVDLGPGHGATGGQVVFQGAFPEILKAPQSLTGAYLSGRKCIEVPPRRLVALNSSAATPPQSTASGTAASALREAAIPFQITPRFTPALRLTHATCHNLRDLAVEIPLRRFVVITGVSGSGKTTLVREILLPALRDSLHGASPDVKASDRLGAPDAVGTGQESGDLDDDQESTAAGGSDLQLEGTEHLGQVVLVDQSILGKTPRSNPAVYIGAFDDIRELFAQSEQAKQNGLNASAFSFNSSQGQCERCRGAGFEKIEMQFLSDVFIRCPDCGGHRYRSHILNIRVGPKDLAKGPGAEGQGAPRRFSIADLLEATVDEAIEFLGGFAGARPAERAIKSLALLQEVGLGYLQLGQPINTLSGGESQRLKLVKHLAEVVSKAGSPESTTKPILFLFDEPTTGLHFDDVRVLLRVFQRLVDAGHSVVVIEHNLDVIKSADWLIDLGPDAGDEGGRIVVVGAPETVAACRASHTGQALRTVLPSGAPEPNDRSRTRGRGTGRRVSATANQAV